MRQHGPNSPVLLKLNAARLKRLRKPPCVIVTLTLLLSFSTLRRSPVFPSAYRSSQDHLR